MALHPNKSNFNFNRSDLAEIARKTESFDNVYSFLMAHGGINATDEYQRTALMHFCTKPFAKEIKQEIHNSIAKELIRCGADINLKDKSGYTALHFTILENNIELIRVLLSQPDIQKNIPNNPLLLALTKNLDLIPLLLEGGINPFIGEEMTPYEFICKYQSGDIFDRLENGRDMTEILELIKKLYPEKEIVVEPFFLNTIHYDYLEIDFHEVFKKKKFAILLEFLNMHGGINSVNQYGRTALIECLIVYSHPARMVGKDKKKIADLFAKELINLGADTNLTDRFGYSALHFAKSGKNKEITDQLTLLSDIKNNET